MVSTAIFAIGIQLVVITAVYAGLYQLLRRYTGPHKDNLESAAASLIIGSVIGDVIAYFWSFNGNSIFYSVLSLACLSMFLAPLGLAAATDGFSHMSNPTWWQRAISSTTLWLSTMVGLLFLGIWAGVADSVTPGLALLDAARAVALAAFVIGSIYALFMGTLQTGGAG